ncbi:MAG: monovalent cation/H+ antiporter subunit D family protein [Candidatus Syntrophonatronum acetioxidans]|uniref:Monovalent cation/H+ antiporter subunit D family protein n=1 Tax=Candidatus Syntrophonatronum acetioxidans TaxID=1795816 RepID=A0A424YAV1_9FIRM|nr:MAG: monovalent cation/H+ antiporter subunit D family protein [Candidatus Syntrophonatronum acetioxidans]
MDTTTSFLPVFISLFPMIMTLVIYYVQKESANLRNHLSIITSVITFLAVAYMYPQIIDGKVLVFELFEIIPEMGFVGTFRVDILSFCLALVSSFVWMLATIFSVDYMSHEHAQNRYYPTLIFTLGGCMGIFMAGDFFTLFIFFELMSVVSYVLVVHEETEVALKAGYKYIIMTIIGGLALLLGVINVFEITGTVSMEYTSLINEPTGLALATFIAFIIGFGMKAGMFPLHVWLPDAHPVAPAPASALLSGVMLKTGAYGLFRVIFNVFSIDFLRETNWIMIISVLGVITILLGSAVAITQFDIKRRLAYSSIGQMGYILVGMSIMTEYALVGAIFHVFSHAFMKSCLFLCAGAIIVKTGKRDMRDLYGIGLQMPVTMIAFTTAALAMIGIPPLNGFLSKWNLALGALGGGVPQYVVVLLISSLMNGLYYLPIIINGFFGEEVHGKGFVADEVPYKMLVPIIILAVCCLIFGVSPINLPFDLSRMAAEMLLRGGF